MKNFYEQRITAKKVFLSKHPNLKALELNLPLLTVIGMCCYSITKEVAFSGAIVDNRRFDVQVEGENFTKS